MTLSQISAIFGLLLALIALPQQALGARVYPADGAPEQSSQIEEEDQGTELDGAGNFLPLCDKGLVRKQCKVMDIGNNPKVVSIAELTWVTSVKHASMVAFLKSIGFADAGEKDGKDEFTCQELCEAIVTSLPAEGRPPTSDMGCRRGQAGEEPIVCDVDVSPLELSQLGFDDEHEEFEDGHAVASGEPDDGLDDLSITGVSVKSEDDELLELDLQQLTVRMANRFRIYPQLDINVDEDVGDVELENETFVDAPSNDSSLAEDGSAGFCTRAICKRVSDCSKWTFFCGGCKACKPAETHSAHKPNWLTDVETVSIKAQAYVARALETAPRSKRLLEKWFGRSDRKTVRKAMYVLNSLSGMLGNVAYKKGPECGPHTYAYVYPSGRNSRNSKGEFVFFLCGVYFRSDLGEKIETLTHEGSHHALAYTDDVWTDKSQRTKAYGRSTCQRLAKTYPERAIVNADSHCYFINDLNGHQ
mmetsp:Transcript_55505/g.129947  ORF Transcript_55505/g.129947 Transcript_55505/m.129947 type:complete len:474 (-) Transcript_55505:185-1606(-)